MEDRQGGDAEVMRNAGVVAERGSVLPAPRGCSAVVAGWLLSWMLVVAAPAAPAEAGADPWRPVARFLDRGDTPGVEALAPQERLVLRATLELKLGRPERVLRLLDGAPSDDPLVGLLEAEAHRRAALRALGRVPDDYGRGLERERRRLASARLDPWLREAEVRLERLRDDLVGRLNRPVDLLQLGPDVANVFLVDKARSRLFAFVRDGAGGWRKLVDSYVVTGSRPGDKQREGDGRTPDGVYRFVGRLEGAQLAPRYGPVAFPIDYPNALDRIHHKDGHGIWLHGYAPQVRRRPPRDTRGCFSLPNDLLIRLAPRILPGKSWVVVGENLRFDDPARREALRRSVAEAIESWRRDWSSLDTDAYLRHYHPAFRSGRLRLAEWKWYKRRINRGKRMIRVALSDITMIHDPNRWPEGEVVVVQFHQEYRSDNYSDRTTKRLYLVRAAEGEPWRILSEETVPDRG
ncbi:MAG: hypothetical protein D6682_05290 [Zetaproteobacteria bacterium]|nr:MAG: hypothetical protein D6682_05290 [Zetaproteobacteria bacterium]